MSNLKDLVHLEAAADIKMRISNYKYEIGQLEKAAEKIVALKERIAHAEAMVEAHFAQVSNARIVEHFKEDADPSGAVNKTLADVMTLAEQAEAAKAKPQIADPPQPETD